MAKRKADQDAEPKLDLLGQLSVELGGAECMLRPSRLAISNIERQLGKALPQLAVQAGSMALSVEEMGIAVAEMMRAYARADPGAGPSHAHAKPEKCADLIFEAGPIDVVRRLAVIFTGAMAGGYTASGEVKAAGMMKATPTAD